MLDENITYKSNTELKITVHVKTSEWGNYSHTISYTVNIGCKLIFVANRLTGNLLVNGTG